MLFTVFRNIIQVCIMQLNGSDLVMPDQPSRQKSVIGPTGEPLTVENLPPPNPKRWVIRRKAEVVIAVHHGLIREEEACERYRISIEEFHDWEQQLAAHGFPGLRVTRRREDRRIDHHNSLPV